VSAAPGICRRELRAALGCFATGVIIVSASYEGREHGMTANSFTSVSLEPPLVLFCTDNNARMTRVLECGVEVGLSVLSAEQESVSRHFAGRGSGESLAQFTWVRGVPLIAGAMMHLVCRVTDSRVAGDHSVQIAEVEHFERFRRSPLVFCSGAYSRLVES
jgi:flavin reductase (DIM6/NTAB) family NADH-FMN oxidoreductase RutF